MSCGMVWQHTEEGTESALSRADADHYHTCLIGLENDEEDEEDIESTPVVTLSVVLYLV